MLQRIARLNELLKREISGILLKEEGFSRNILVTVTRAETSPNLSEVKAFISVMPKDRQKEVMESLKNRIYHIQQNLNKELRLRKIPKIVFCEEKRVEEAGRIEKLISKIHNSERRDKIDH